MWATTDDIEDWLVLHLIPGLGNVVIRRLVERYGDPKGVFNAGVSDLMRVSGVREQTARKIAQRASSADPQVVLRKLERLGARLIPYSDPAYPPMLREVPDPPMLLYVKGQDIQPSRTFVAVVGSRNPTPYGRAAAEKIAQGLARRGVGVVSGMARGIDAAAHWGCLVGRGFTLAVLGTGIDVLYPKSNEKLFHKILESGAVLSEYPLGTPPEPKNFPIRNRIISGLSRGVAVIEATKQSGSLITASLALEQGREVFAVPGSINSFKSTGCHYLIKQGAPLIENSDDILEELGLNHPHGPKTDTFTKPALPPMDETESRLYDLIGDYPVHIDQLARESGLEPGRVASVLMRMELRGVVQQLPGKMFVR